MALQEDDLEVNLSDGSNDEVPPDLKDKIATSEGGRKRQRSKSLEGTAQLDSEPQDLTGTCAAL